MLELIMDFITGLPPTKIRTGEVSNTILVIINRYKVFRILCYYNNNHGNRTSRPVFGTVVLIWYTKGNYI
jgi:hypothetical protein